MDMFSLPQLAKIATNMVALIISLSFHEAAHASMSYAFGDKTAKREGRLTLNPAAHTDVLGTLVLPLVGSFLGGGFFGWAKPVPVSSREMRFPRLGMMCVAAAGPLANLLLSLVALAAVIWAQLYHSDRLETGTLGGTFYSLAVVMLILNPILAFFNLIPLPPLDGGAILRQLLPYRLASKYDEYVTPYGFYFLLAILVSGGLGWTQKWAQVWLAGAQRVLLPLLTTGS